LNTCLLGAIQKKKKRTRGRGKKVGAAKEGRSTKHLSADVVHFRSF
jgi:hypothetical protein